MASSSLEPSIRSGRARIDAIPYSEIAARLAGTNFDLAILHTAQPDTNSLCSFGIACEAPGIVWPRSKHRVAYVNARMPRMAESEGIPADQIDLAVSIDEPLLSPLESPKASPALDQIARYAARLVPDGAVIQSGIGEAPAAVIAALKDHHGLCIHSGIITPEYRQLAEAGALDAAAAHVTGIAWGPADFYDWLATAGFAFRSVFETHDYKALGQRSKFTSIGSALEVDLAGAINLEWAGDRRVSSVGGAPDYVQAASASPGGRSIIALPSTARSGASRIVARLAHASIPASLADTVVTEHGVAELKGLSAMARAKRLISIAAPEHRDTLVAWLAHQQP
jgi:acyl-CoA hydrolase